MAILTYILRHVIENSKYPIFNVCPMYFFSDIPNKFKNIQKEIIENDFFEEKQKKVYLELFSKAQKHYYSFSKLAKIWKTNKYSYYNNDVDLCLKPLSSYPESQKVTLIHLKKKYIFRLTDFMNIWLRSLTKNKGFSPNPRYPINPYINRPFRKHHLYTVYFKLIDSTFMIPPLIQSFYKMHFNITKFELVHYPILKDHAINNYMQDEEDITLFLDIIHMIETFKIELDFAYIDPRMPNIQVNEIVNVMKPYLKDFFLGSLSCNPLTRELARTSSLNGLRCFFNRFPLYGTLQYHGVSRRDLSVVEYDVEDDEDDIEYAAEEEDNIVMSDDSL
jgi:hypothetical protein